MAWSGVGDAWRKWIKREPPAKTLLVVGGGPFADAVRGADDVHRLSAWAAHELAIGAMSLSARLARSLLNDCERLASHAALGAWAAKPRGSVGIVDIDALLQEAKTREAPLGRLLARIEPSWDITSDSLAAAVAHALEINALILLKSDDPPPGASLEELAAGGYVDRYFPIAARGLAVRCVNLRVASPDAYSR